MAKDTPLDEFQARTLRTLQAWAEPDHEITQPEAFLTQALLADGTQDETDRDQGGEDIARSAGRRQWLSSHGLLGIVAALVSQGDSLANRPGTAIPNLAPWHLIRRESLLRSLKMEAAALAVAKAFKGLGGDWAIMKGSDWQGGSMTPPTCGLAPISISWSNLRIMNPQSSYWLR